MSRSSVHKHSEICGSCSSLGSSIEPIPDARYDDEGESGARSPVLQYLPGRAPTKQIRRANERLQRCSRSLASDGKGNFQLYCQWAAHSRVETTQLQA